jgi:hypothetical protein
VLITSRCVGSFEEIAMRAARSLHDERAARVDGDGGARRQRPTYVPGHS